VIEPAVRVELFRSAPAQPRRYLLGTIVSASVQLAQRFKCALCYINAMIRKHLAATAALLALVFGLSAVAAQGSNPAARQSKPTPAAPSSASPGTPAQSVPASSGEESSGAGNSSASSTPCQGAGCENPTPHITIATPAPAPAPWPLQERISWVANLILVLYVVFGVTLAQFLLRKVERQGHYAEVAAQAAVESSKAVLVYAQSLAAADRPWVLVTAETVPGVPDKFNIVATNRGHGPARIVSVVDEIASAGDDSKLPPTPVYKNEPQPLASSDILLPGESVGIKSFSRDEVSAVCETPEQLQLVEAWVEKIYLYGNVTYQDLRATDGTQPHETSWCCWYIHGRQKSGMVAAGPPAYNRHT